MSTPRHSPVNIPDPGEDPSPINLGAPAQAPTDPVDHQSPDTDHVHHGTPDVVWLDKVPAAAAAMNTHAPCLADAQQADAPRMSTVERVPLAVRAVATLTAQSYDEADAELACLGSVTVSPSAQAAVAHAYASLPELPEPDDENAVRAAWDAFRWEISAQAQTLIGMGFSLESVDTDPYGSAAEMFADVSRFRIRVLATKITGSHPYLSDQENDLFRAVHDVLGHAATGRGFDRHGEEAAYRSHAALFSRTARAALATETRGQNAALIHSEDGQTFDAQRLGILPAWARDVEALDPLPHERSAAVADAVQHHTASGLRTEGQTRQAR